MTVLAEITIRLEVPDDVLARLASVGATIQAAPVPSAPAGTTGSGGVSAAVRNLVETRAPKAVAGRYLEFLERCVRDLGAQPAVPKSGDRPVVNINPPAGRRGARLAVFNVSSGRLALTDLGPELADEWPSAEVVSINDAPDHLKIYIKDDDHLDTGVEMARAVLERR